MPEVLDKEFVIYLSVNSAWTVLDRIVALIFVLFATFPL